MELQASGRWWFPNENIPQPGTLVFDEEESLLTISGPFLPTVGTYAARDKKDFIILGELADGQKITLISYFGGNKHETIGQQYVFSDSEFYIKFVIIGFHFENIDDMKFESCLVEYTNLFMLSNLTFTFSLTSDWFVNCS
jgi:ApeA-like protein